MYPINIIHLFSSMSIASCPSVEVGMKTGHSQSHTISECQLYCFKPSHSGL